MNCCSKKILILGFGRFVTTECPEYCRASDTGPDRVAEPIMGSALRFSQLDRNAVRHCWNKIRKEFLQNIGQRVSQERSQGFL